MFNKLPKTFRQKEEEERQKVFEEAKKHGVIWCDARVSSAGWYEREAIGMSRFGEVFLKEGLEYVRMKKTFVPVSDVGDDRVSDSNPTS